MIVDPLQGEQSDENDDEEYAGDCVGPDSVYVKLVSSDGHEFIIKRQHALLSRTINLMLREPRQVAENQTNEIHFREIPAHVLQNVCLYFTQMSRHMLNRSSEIPESAI